MAAVKGNIVDHGGEDGRDPHQHDGGEQQILLHKGLDELPQVLEKVALFHAADNDEQGHEEHQQRHFHVLE